MKKERRDEGGGKRAGEATRGQAKRPPARRNVGAHRREEAGRGAGPATGTKEPSLDDLRLFVKACAVLEKAGASGQPSPTLGEIAERLGVHRPRLSELLADLEGVWGLPAESLARRRGRRGCELTGTGELVHRRAKAVIVAYERCVSGDELPVRPTRTVIRLGTTPLVELFALEPIIDKFLARDRGRETAGKPARQFEFRVSLLESSSAGLNELEEGRIDLYIGDIFRYGETPSGVTREDFELVVKRVVLLPKNARGELADRIKSLQEKTMIELRDLEDCPLCYSDPPDRKDRLVEERDSQAPRVMLGSSEAARRFCLKGGYVALGVNWKTVLGADYQNHFEVRPLRTSQGVPEYRMGAFVPTDPEPPKEVAEFVKCARQHFAEESKKVVRL